MELKISSESSTETLAVIIIGSVYKVYMLSDGGEVVATGAPRDVAAASASHTGQYLQRYLNR